MTDDFSKQLRRLRGRTKTDRDMEKKSSIELDIGAKPGREGCEGIPEGKNQGKDGLGRRASWSAVMRNSHGGF